MTSPLVVIVAVEAFGAAFLTFLVTMEEAVCFLVVARELFCLVGDLVRKNFKKRKIIVGINKGKEQEKRGVRGE